MLNFRFLFCSMVYSDIYNLKLKLNYKLILHTTGIAFQKMTKLLLTLALLCSISLPTLAQDTTGTTTTITTTPTSTTTTTSTDGQLNEFTFEDNEGILIIVPLEEEGLFANEEQSNEYEAGEYESAWEPFEENVESVVVVIPPPVVVPVTTQPVVTPNGDPTTLGQNVDQAANNAGNAIDNTANNVGTGISNTFDAGVNDAGQAATDVGNAADSAVNAVGNAAGAAGTDITNAATAAGNDIANAWNNLFH